MAYFTEPIFHRLSRDNLRQDCERDIEAPSHNIRLFGIGIDMGIDHWLLGKRSLSNTIADMGTEGFWTRSLEETSK